jgi:secreted trypsin-like serine protease
MIRKFTELLAGLFLLVSAVAPVSSAESERIEVAPGVYFQSADGLVSSSPEARQIPAARSGRIVGGTETTITQWPWQTAIFGNGWFCGGTLLTPTFVVSAAHCFYDGGFTDPALYSVITGRTRLSTSAGQQINFDTYFYFVDGFGNPLYNPNDSDWDVVLIRLAAPSVSPTIKIAGPDERATWAAGRAAFITGWGTTAEGGVLQDALRFGQVAIVDDLICADRYAGVGPIYLDTMMCAGRVGGGVDTCQGDSGGPLVVPIAGGGFRLVGDTSFGIGCARAEFPGVYGRLADDSFRSGIQAICEQHSCAATRCVILLHRCSQVRCPFCTSGRCTLRFGRG